MVKIYINSLFCLILQICFDSVKSRFLSNEDKIVRGVDIYIDGFESFDIEEDSVHEEIVIKVLVIESCILLCALRS